MEMYDTMVVILAGGAGTRIASVLRDVPKPMAMMQGRPFIHWVVRYYARYGFAHFRISTGHLGNIIEDYFCRTSFPKAQVCCVREEKPSGTAGGFLRAVAGGGAPPGGYLVVNGDSLLLADPLVLISAARANGWEAALFGLTVADARRYGALEVDAAWRLQGFKEKGAASGLINAGVYWFAAGCPSQFPQRLPLSFEHDVFPSLLQAAVPVGVAPVEAPFIDIGTPASLSVAESFIEKHAMDLV
jgi:NDP-sugar pyrophosphorylase family protein